MYQLQVLSPIHVSSGETMNPLQMRVQEGQMHVYAWQDIWRHVAQEQQIYSLVQRKIREAGVRRNAKGLALHDVVGTMSGQPLQTLHIERKALKPDLVYAEIQQTYTNLKGPYIPGSTIKGLVKTALLPSWTAHKSDEQVVKSFFIRRDNGFDPALKREMEQLLKSKGGYLEAGDAQFSTPLTIVEYEIMARKKGLQDQTFFVQAIVDSISQPFSLGLASRERLKQSFHHDVERETIVQDFTLRLYEHSARIIDEHLTYFANVKHEQHAVTDQLIAFLQEMKQRNTKEAPIIILGKGSSMIAKTLFTRLNKQVLERFKAAIISGQPKVREQLVKAPITQYPSSRVVVQHNGRYVLPGFAQLQVVQQ